MEVQTFKEVATGAQLNVVYAFLSTLPLWFRVGERGQTFKNRLRFEFVFSSDD